MLALFDVNRRLSEESTQLNQLALSRPYSAPSPPPPLTRQHNASFGTLGHHPSTMGLILLTHMFCSAPVLCWSKRFGGDIGEAWYMYLVKLR